MNTPANPATLPGLLPCPFCGSRPYVGLSDSYAESVRCTNPECAANPQTIGYSQQQAADRWNRRAEGIAASRSGAGELQVMRDAFRAMKREAELSPNKTFELSPDSIAEIAAFIDTLAAANLAGGDGEDSKRLDWLESQGCSYGFEDMIEGNRWDVSGAYMTLRELCDAATKADAARKESDNAR